MLQFVERKKVIKPTKPKKGLFIGDLVRLMGWSYRDIIYFDDEFRILPGDIRLSRSIQWDGREMYILKSKRFDIWVFAGSRFPVVHDGQVKGISGSVRDWWKNFQCGMVPLAPRGEFAYQLSRSGARVHQGAAGTLGLLREHLGYSTATKRPLIIGGHSKGWMEAMLAGVWALDHGYRVSMLFGAGCPRVGNKVFVDAIAERIPIIAFSNGLDPVPFLPPRWPTKIAAFLSRIAAGGDEYESLPALHLENGNVRVRDVDEMRRGEWWRAIRSCPARVLHALNDHDMLAYQGSVEKLPIGAKGVIQDYLRPQAERTGIDPVAAGLLRRELIP